MTSMKTLPLVLVVHLASSCASCASCPSCECLMVVVAHGWEIAASAHHRHRCKGAGSRSGEARCIGCPDATACCRGSRTCSVYDSRRLVRRRGGLALRGGADDKAAPITSSMRVGETEAFAIEYLKACKSPNGPGDNDLFVDKVFRHVPAQILTNDAFAIHSTSSTYTHVSFTQIHAYFHFSVHACKPHYAHPCRQTYKQSHVYVHT